MRVQGNTSGLKTRERRALDRLADRRLPPAALITREFARRIAAVSRAVRRQVGVLVDRRGAVTWVGVGDAHRIELPDLKRQRVAGVRLRGLRCVHTHLAGEGLTRDDLTDLVLLRLDLMAALTVGEDGLPGVLHAAHLRVPGAAGDDDEGVEPWERLPPTLPGRLDPLLDLDCLALASEIERGFARLLPERPSRRFAGRAVLVGAVEGAVPLPEAMDELAELAADAGLEVADRVVQRRARPDPRTLLGRGKLEALVIRALDRGADALLFSSDLSPSQARNISAATDLKVLDRTQLILDVFSRRARSREGRLQVELAQLRYRLPRLTRQDTSLSRLGGGIGGRGPGETRLEVDRRRTRDRIARLERDLRGVAGVRELRRKRRGARGLPVVSLVGYTNAGKSTLLNRLTRSEVAAGDRMFETLEPASRRLRVPVEREVLLADTVGFIHDLPESLIEAFRATLEEISAASLLLHVVDASSERLETRMRAVDGLLAELGYAGIPRLVLLNKVDLLSRADLAALERRLAAAEPAGGTAPEALGISAATGAGLDAVVRAVARLIPRAASARREAGRPAFPYSADDVRSGRARPVPAGDRETASVLGRAGTGADAVPPVLRGSSPG